LTKSLIGGLLPLSSLLKPVGDLPDICASNLFKATAHSHLIIALPKVLTMFCLFCRGRGKLKAITAGVFFPISWDNGKLAGNLSQNSC
jgi:hypothetical protein